MDKLLDSKKNKTLGKLILPHLDSKKLTINPKHFKWNLYIQHFLHSFSLHLNEFLHLRFIEQEDYNVKMEQIDQLWIQFREFDEKQNKKKMNKQNMDPFISDIFQQFQQLSFQIGIKDLRHLLTIFFFQHLEDIIVENDDFCDYLDILDKYFLIFGVQHIQDEQEKEKFLSLYNITNEQNEMIVIKNLLTSSSSKNRQFLEKIDGATIILILHHQVIVCHGIFKKDSLGLCKYSSIYSQKMKIIEQDLQYIDVPKDFKDPYIEQLSLRDFLVNPSREIILTLKNDYQELQSMRGKSLSSIIKEFVKSTPEKQRKILILYLLGDDECKFNAHIIYDLISTQNVTHNSILLADMIYRSFHWKIQKVFKLSNKVYEDSKKKVENLSLQDIPYETRIAALKVSDHVKSKALEKMKEINGSKDNSNKAQQWLDGFFKLPFGVYRNEPVMKFLKDFQSRFETYILQLESEFISIQQEYSFDTSDEKLYSQTLEYILHEYHTSIHKNSEYSYERYFSTIHSTLSNLHSQKKSNKQMMSSPIQLDDYSLHIDIETIEEDQLFDDIYQQLSEENKKKLKVMFEKRDLIDTQKMEKCMEELNEFKKLKQKWIESETFTELHIEYFNRKLEEIESHFYSILQQQQQQHSSSSSFSSFFIKHQKLFIHYIDEWNQFKEMKKSTIQQVDQILDQCTYGQFDAKRQMKRLIAQWMNGNNEKGSVIGLYGPPGVGKTSLLKHGLSKCLIDENGESRPLVFIPIGGSSNGSFLEGHNYTYLGSTWGKIADCLMEAKCMNPIIFIDELDKMSKTEHGKEIASILTHITDETQNHEFYDRYFASIPLDLSRVLFVFSYNDREKIDPILRDRIQEIEIKGLSKYEKIVICKNYILPEIYNNVGFGKDEIIFPNEILGHLIENYTMEQGCRKIKEILLNCVRDINIMKIHNEIQSFPYHVSMEFIQEFMEDKRKVRSKIIHNRPMTGICNGLWANSLGMGGITLIQMAKMFDCEKKISIEKITGGAEEDMVESVNYGFCCAVNLFSDNFKNKLMEKPYTIHCHMGDSGKKSGPSGGAVITTCFVSLLSGIPIKNYFCGTGEITITGRVTAVGGIEHKLDGAIRAGCTLCCIPKENEEDLRVIIKKDRDNKKKMLRSESMKSFDLSPVMEHETFDFILDNNKVMYKDKLMVYLVDNIVDFLKIALVENDMEWNSSFITKDFERDL